MNKDACVYQAFCMACMLHNCQLGVVCSNYIFTIKGESVVDVTRLTNPNKNTTRLNKPSILSRMSVFSPQIMDLCC